MLKSKEIPEKQLTAENITNRVKFYHWPYSQPRIVNTVKASSKTGKLLGLLTIPLVLKPIYIFKNILFLDLILVLTYLILNVYIIPAIRRNQIRYTPSESRRVNYFGLLFSSMLVHSAVIRSTVAILLYIINNIKNTSFGEALMDVVLLSVQGISLSFIGISLAIGALPIILILYPKDVKVLDYHYSLLELKRSTYQPTGFKETVREEIPPFPSYTPKYTSTTRPVNKEVPPTPSPRPKNNKTTGNGNTSTNNKPKNTQTKHSPSTDIWETKISKRTRRDD